MKRLLIVLVLVLFVLGSGCSYYRAKKTEQQAREQLAQAQAQADAIQQQAAYATKQLQDQQRTVTSDSDTAEDQEKPTELVIPGSGGDSGEDVGLRKLGTQYRDKDATEKCDIDYPFSCMSYIASEGQVDITIKYLAYAGKLEDVSLYFNGDECDPSGAAIEPGTKQKFTCYADESGSYVSGDLELKYYESLERVHYTKTGSLTAKWE